MLEAEGQGNTTWKEPVENESVNVGVRREDVLCRSKCSVGVNHIVTGLRFVTARFTTFVSFSLEVIPATLTSWAYIRIHNIGLFLS